MANFRRPSQPEPVDLDGLLRGAIERGGLPIPPYPAVALRIQQVVSRGEFGLDEVARLVSSDASLAADVLRCANSAFYSRGEAVTGISQAITRLGAQEVMRIALGSGLAAQGQGPGSLATLKRAVWIEGVVSAVLCQELARHRGLAAGEAFVLGLLHDFGHVVVLCYLETLLSRDASLGPRPLEEWKAVVERHHVAAGLATATRWKLPAGVSEVIAAHHGDARPEARGTLLSVVRDADQVTSRLSAHSQLSDADLAEVRSLTAAEREVVTRLVERIPAFVAAFEAPPERKPVQPSMVAVPLTTLAPGQRPVTFGVTVVLEKRPRPCVAAAIAPNGLVALASEPLPESQLCELTLHCQPREFKVWATARLCRPEGSGFRLEFQPFALSGEAKGLWGQLYRSAQPVT